MKAVMYGAGNIGRGFVGYLFASSGYEVSFIDIDGATIHALQKEHRYPVRLLSNDGHIDLWAEGVTGVDGRDTEAAACAIASADIMATAVGVRVLPFIAPVIAAGLRKRFEKNSEPLNIIICENLLDADKLLEKLIMENLTAGERRIFKERIGLVEASIGRMVPLQTPELHDGNPLRVCTEAYGFLPVDGNAFVGKPPPVSGMMPYNNFGFYIQRKLFVHNMGHAICAYLGGLAGDTYIAQSIARADVFAVVQNAMLESAIALSKKYNMPLDGILDHINDLLRRFSNRALGDTCARVGADTARKLSPDDRLVGALHCCTEQGVIPAYISLGIAAAIHRHIFDNAGENRQSIKLVQNAETAASVLKDISALDPGCEEGVRILAQYQLVIQGADIARLRKAALEAGHKAGVI